MATQQNDRYFETGRADFAAGKKGRDCPYENQHCRNRWMDGWLDAQAEEGAEVLDDICAGRY